MKKIIFSILISIFIVIVTISLKFPHLLVLKKNPFTKTFFEDSSGLVVTDFNECVFAGNPIMESYPRQCMHQGKNFIEDIITETPKTTDESEKPITKITEVQARIIAQNSCVKRGESLSPGTYNEITKTWWFNAELNSTQPGCSPACVVSEETQSAEINWRCTGAILPQIEPALVGKQWFWTHTLYSTDQLDTPQIPNSFGLTFDPNKHVSIASDCNAIHATYSTGVGEALVISGIVSTKMACADSQESLFVQSLGEVISYNFGTKGELNLVLKDNKGIMVFK
jgi:heat shock protein HslJ